MRKAIIMKQSVSPATAAIIVVALVAVVGFFLYRGTSTQQASGGPPPAMPPGGAAEWNKYTGGKSTPGMPGADTKGAPSGPPR